MAPCGDADMGLRTPVTFRFDREGDLPNRSAIVGCCDGELTADATVRDAVGDGADIDGLP